MPPKKQLNGHHGYPQNPLPGYPPADWKDVFISVLRDTGNVREACGAAFIGRSAVYDHRNEDADFAEQWADALEDYKDRLRFIAQQRAEEKSDYLMGLFLTNQCGFNSGRAAGEKSQPADPTAVVPDTTAAAADKTMFLALLKNLKRELKEHADTEQSEPESN